MTLRIVATAFALAACNAPEARLLAEDDIVGDEIPAALTNIPGNVDRGLSIFVNRDAGHCVLCHAIEGLNAEFQGNLGPDLSAVGARLNAGQLRLRLVDYTQVLPETPMPSYYRIHDLHQVSEDFKGKPVLGAQDIEDLIAYLVRQKDDDADD